MAWTRSVDTRAISANGTFAPSTLTELPLGNNQFQAVQTSGTGSITIRVQVSNDNVTWEDAITFISTGTGFKDYGTIVNSWRYFRYVATALSGTCTVTLYLSGG